MFIYIFDRVAHGLGTDAWLQYGVIVGGPAIASVVVVLITRKVLPSLAKSVGFIM